MATIWTRILTPTHQEDLTDVMAMNVPIVLHHIEMGNPVIAVIKPPVKLNHAGSAHPVGIKVIELTTEGLEGPITLHYCCLTPWRSALGVGGGATGVQTAVGAGQR